MPIEKKPHQLTITWTPDGARQVRYVERNIVIEDGEQVGEFLKETAPDDIGDIVGADHAAALKQVKEAEERTHKEILGYQERHLQFRDLMEGRVANAKREGEVAVERAKAVEKELMKPHIEKLEKDLEETKAAFEAEESARKLADQHRMSQELRAAKAEHEKEAALTAQAHAEKQRNDTALRLSEVNVALDTAKEQTRVLAAERDTLKTERDALQTERDRLQTEVTTLKGPKK
jgi:chromosome segregation ATPase